MLTHSERKCGQIVIDFINAKTTDEACFTHFANMKDFLKFQPKFVDLAKDVFLPISPVTSLKNSEKQFIRLIIEDEEKIKSRVNERLEMIGHELHDYDYDKDSLLLSEYSVFGAGCFEGEPDVSVETFGPFWITVDEFHSTVRHEIGRGLKSDTFDLIERMMQISRGAVDKLKDELSENRICELRSLAQQYDSTLQLHEQIETIQRRFRDVIEKVLEGKYYHEVRDLRLLILKYNELPKSKLWLGDGNIFTEDSDYEWPDF